MTNITYFYDAIREYYTSSSASSSSSSSFGEQQTSPRLHSGYGGAASPLYTTTVSSSFNGSQTPQHHRPPEVEIEAASCLCTFIRKVYLACVGKVPRVRDRAGLARTTLPVWAAHDRVGELHGQCGAAQGRQPVWTANMPVWDAGWARFELLNREGPHGPSRLPPTLFRDTIGKWSCRWNRTPDRFLKVDMYK